MFYPLTKKKRPFGGPGLADRRFHSFMHVYIHSCMHAFMHTSMHAFMCSTPFVPSLYQACVRYIERYQGIAYEFLSFNILPGTNFPHRLPVPLCIKWRGWTESLGFLSFSKINCYFSDSNACSALPGRAAMKMKLEHEHESALPSEKHCSECDALASLLLP